MKDAMVMLFVAESCSCLPRFLASDDGGHWRELLTNKLHHGGAVSDSSLLQLNENYRPQCCIPIMIPCPDSLLGLANQRARERPYSCCFRRLNNLWNRLMLSCISLHCPLDMLPPCFHLLYIHNFSIVTRATVRTCGASTAFCG